MNRRVTQEDIAKRLNVDKSTVSLALRNSPHIGAATRAKVAAMAEEMGYRPDPALSTLARQRWAGHELGSGAALAYLVDSRMPGMPSHRRFLSAARQRAEQRGYCLTEFDLATYPTVESASRVLFHRGIRGVLVPQFALTDGPGILQMPVENLTVVCLDLGWVPVPFHIVMPDNFEATRRVWSEAVKRGYRRVGGAVLRHTPQALDDAARFGASIASQQDWIAPSDRVPLLTTDPLDRDSFCRWLDEHDPDVVIAFIDRVYDWIVSTGRRVPEDVAFAALKVFTGSSPNLSGISREDNSVGSVGVDVLIAAMNENESGVPALQRKLMLEPIWHEGATLPMKRRADPTRAKHTATSP